MHCRKAHCVSRVKVHRTRLIVEVEYSVLSVANLKSGANEVKNRVLTGHFFQQKQSKNRAFVSIFQ